MTCKDCLHYEVCYYHDFDGCEHFKDKSEWVHLPVKVGDEVWVIDEYDEYVSGVMFLSISNGYLIASPYVYGREENCLEYHAEATDEEMETPLRVYRKFYLTKEEAEKALEERKRR